MTHPTPDTPAVPPSEAKALADPEVVGADHGHWSAQAFPDADYPGVEHLVCECGMPWTPGEGCLFIQGVRSQRLASDWLAKVKADARAEALRDAADEWGGTERVRFETVAKWLRNRAAALAPTTEADR